MPQPVGIFTEVVTSAIPKAAGKAGSKLFQLRKTLGNEVFAKELGNFEAKIVPLTQDVVQIAAEHPVINKVAGEVMQDGMLGYIKLSGISQNAALFGKEKAKEMQAQVVKDFAHDLNSKLDINKEELRVAAQEIMQSPQGQELKQVITEAANNPVFANTANKLKRWAGIESEVSGAELKQIATELKSQYLPDSLANNSMVNGKLENLSAKVEVDPEAKEIVTGLANTVKYIIGK